MATAYKYTQLGAKGGACTTRTQAGALYPVAHMAAKGGKVTLCGHGLANVAKLASLRRNWVYVQTPVTCRMCKGAMAQTHAPRTTAAKAAVKAASKPRAPKVPKVATTTATATAPVTAPATVAA